MWDPDYIIVGSRLHYCNIYWSLLKSSRRSSLLSKTQVSHSHTTLLLSRSDPRKPSPLTGTLLRVEKYVSPEMIVQRASTSFPSSTPQWKYDVFLSFRGEDTRRGFTDNLYNELEHEGIITFRDDPQLQKGETIAQALFAAIEESRFSVIVLSQNYASSTWCLNELVKILECMNERGRVLPIFYDVDPSDVRKQTGSFEEAFANHEERFADDKEIVQKWRSALTEVASFSGWNSKDWYERKLIRAIVEDVLKKLQPASFSFAKNLVGMNSRLQPVFLHLGVGVDDVRFIGIWGMGGIGKTTMVRTVCERISREFEFSFLLNNVRETVERGGLLNLQKQLLSGMIQTKEVNHIYDLHEGAAALKRWFCRKKVLLILDDVSQPNQLEYLAGSPDWFASGSRVLITTRNEHLLIQHEVKRRLKVEELNDDDSLQLFSMKAFKRDYPEEGFLGLSESVISYVKGLPLALEVLGSFLYGRDLSEWISALSQSGKVCSSDIFDVLKISYNDLDSDWKKIFLDIACFFNGHEKDRVTEVLNCCDIAAIIGIKVLMERSLVTLSDGRLWMHDLLREMGHETVRLESPNELGRRSRLWLYEDVNYVLTHNTGTEAMEGIFLDSTKSGVDVTPKSFSMMQNLRYLKIKNVNLPKGLEYLPNSLRILDWTRYPLKSLPADFNPQKLFELTLCHSCLRHVQIGTEPLCKLKSINLSHSLNLVKTPNLKDMPYLEILCLEGCISLNELDPGIELLKKLSLLNLKDCKNLVHFAGSVRGLKSLKVLNLSSCSKVKKLPNDMGDLESLEELYLNGTSIKEVPMSTGRPERLSLLNLKDCKNLVCLPSNIGGLKSLKDLNLSGCSKLEKLPDELGLVACLEKLDLSGSGMREVPSCIGLLNNLKELSFAGCKAQSLKSWSMRFNPIQLLRSRCTLAGLSLPFLSGLRSLTHLNLSDRNLSEEAMPSDFGCLASLKQLYLRNNQFIRLPESICQLSQLEHLDLEGCRELRIVPELLCDVWVCTDDCISLDTFGNQIGLSNSMATGYYTNCLKMVENESCERLALLLLARYLKRKTSLSMRSGCYFVCPGNEIGEWYNHRSVGSSITIEVHPGWLIKKFIGFAVCAVFRLLKPFPPSVQWTICCSLTANGKHFNFPVFGFGGRWVQPVGNHIMFSYMDTSKVELQDIYYQFEFSIEPSSPWSGEFDKKNVLVNKWGVRLVYEQDVEELRQTYILKQSNTKRGLQLLLSDHDDAASSSASQAHPDGMKP